MSAKDLQMIRRKIIPILRRYGTKRAALFGSCLTKGFRRVGDVDILVDLRDDMDLLDVVGMKIEMEDALGKKVDLVEYQLIKPALRDDILKHQVAVL